MAALAVTLLAPEPAGRWLHQRLIVEPQATAVEAAARNAATSAATATAAAVARWRAGLSGFAADPVARAGLSGDRETVETALRERFADALTVRMVSGAEALSPTDFVAQQLVRSVLGGETFAVAALKDTEAGWTLLLAAPIAMDGKPGGAALVSLPTRALEQELKFARGTGQLTLTQQAPGVAAQAFLVVGARSAVAPVGVPVPGVPEWQASLRLSPAVAAEHAPPVWLGVTVRLGPWLVALALLVFAGRHAWAHLPVPQPPAAPRPEPAPVRRTALVVEREGAETAPPAPQPPATEEAPLAADTCPASVFRDYDIRGAAGSEISPIFAGDLGRALGALVGERGGGRVAVARDGRISSPELCAALVEGLLASGADVVDIGLVPTPVLCFAAARLPDITATAMVTASHNPAGDNGFKLALGGEPVHGAALLELRRRMLAREWPQGAGQRLAQDVREDYQQAVVGDLPIRLTRKVVVDCGNGAASEIAPRLLEALGCVPIPLYCEIDGTFPNHPPDPVCAANLQDLRKAVTATGADLGIALDGDGDRLVAVSGSGRIVWPDELMLIFARDILPAHPGADIVFDVKSTRRLGTLISSYGGRPVMYRTGHSHIRNKTAELGAPLGGEFSGHIFFRDRWLGCDDALYAAARLLEILERREQSLDEVLATLEPTVATDELRLPVPERDKFALVERARTAAHFEDARIVDLDGLRVEFASGWGLLRASNTEPAITFRFEADDRAQLDAIRARFQALLDAVAPDYRLRI